MYISYNIQLKLNNNINNYKKNTHTYSSKLYFNLNCSPRVSVFKNANVLTIIIRSFMGAGYIHVCDQVR